MYEYPDNALRGIINKSEEFIKNGKPTKSVFKKGFEKNGNRYELSVTWDVDGNGLRIMKNIINERNGKRRYVSVVVIPKKSLDLIKSLPQLIDKLDYEQKPVDGNEYHGNIFLIGEVDDLDLECLSSTLCNCALEIKYFD